MRLNEQIKADRVVVDAQYAAERRELEALRAAARKFITKVESGKARSFETYTELKAALRIGQ